MLARVRGEKAQETGAEFRLSEERRNPARNVLMHADTYQGIQGEADIGKTAALAMVREIADGESWNVLGRSSVVRELQESSGIKLVRLPGRSGDHSAQSSLFLRSSDPFGWEARTARPNCTPRSCGAERPGALRAGCDATPSPDLQMHCERRWTKEDGRWYDGEQVRMWPVIRLRTTVSIR